MSIKLLIYANSAKLIRERVQIDTSIVKPHPASVHPGEDNDVRDPRTMKWIWKPKDFICFYKRFQTHVVRKISIKIIKPIQSVLYPCFPCLFFVGFPPSVSRHMPIQQNLWTICRWYGITCTDKKNMTKYTNWPPGETSQTCRIPEFKILRKHAVINATTQDFYWELLNTLLYHSASGKVKFHREEASSATHVEWAKRGHAPSMHPCRSHCPSSQMRKSLWWCFWTISFTTCTMLGFSGNCLRPAR